MTEPRTLRLRPSALPLAWTCAQSLLGEDDALAIESGDTGPADLGSAAHVLLRYVDGRPGAPEIADVAKRYGVDPEDLEILVATGRKVYRNHLAWRSGPEADVERPLAHTEQLGRPIGPYTQVTIEGTADRVVVNGAAASIDDWKTGRVDRDHSKQMLGYAMLVAANHPEVEAVSVAVVYLRLGWYDVRTMSRGDVREAWLELLQRIRDGVGIYRPGSHCDHCPRRHACPGAKQYGENSLAVVDADGPRDAVRDLSPENADELGPAVVNLYRRARSIKILADDVLSQIRAKAAELDIPDGEGRVLRLQELNKRACDVRRAWPVLTEQFTEDELIGATKVSLSQLETALRAKSARGEKKAAVEAFRAELDAAGAVQPVPSTMLREVKA